MHVMYVCAHVWLVGPRRPAFVRVTRTHNAGGATYASGRQKGSLWRAEGSIRWCDDIGMEWLQGAPPFAPSVSADCVRENENTPVTCRIQTQEPKDTCCLARARRGTPSLSHPRAQREARRTAQTRILFAHGEVTKKDSVGQVIRVIIVSITLLRSPGPRRKTVTLHSHPSEESVKKKKLDQNQIQSCPRP